MQNARNVKDRLRLRRVLTNAQRLIDNNEQYSEEDRQIQAITGRQRCGGGYRIVRKPLPK